MQFCRGDGHNHALSQTAIRTGQITQKMGRNADRTRASKRPAESGRRGLDAQIRESCLQLLEPLAGLMLRAGIGAGELSDICRRAYVLAATQTLATPRRRPNASRIAVATGLTRQEVARLLRVDKSPRKLELKQLQRANRVLAGWHADLHYSTRPGVPKPLPIGGSGYSFQRLVRTYGGDVPPRAVLDELRRASAVSTTSSGAIVPRRKFVEYGIRPQKHLQDVARKLSALAETLVHNTQDPRSTLFEGIAETHMLKADHFPIAVRRLSVGARRFINATNLYLSGDKRYVQSTRRRKRYRSLGVGVYLFSKPR